MKRSQSRDDPIQKKRVIESTPTQQHSVPPTFGTASYPGKGNACCGSNTRPLGPLGDGSNTLLCTGVSPIHDTLITTKGQDGDFPCLNQRHDT